MSTELHSGLQKLIDAGTITREQAHAVQHELGQNSAYGFMASPTRSMVTSSREFISEALTYVGFVFVIAAATLLTNQAWAGLGRWGRPGLFAVGALVLFGSGIWLRMARTDDSGRRLSSTLFVGSQALVAGTTGLILNEIWVPKNASYLDASNPLWKDTARWVNPAMVVGIGFAALLVGVIAYILSSSALGQIAMAVPSAAMALGTGQLIWALTTDTYSSGPDRIGFTILFCGGLLWIALEHFGYLHEKVVGQVLGLTALYVGLQGIDTNLQAWVSGTALIVLGVVLLVFYLKGHAWPYLAGGILGMFAGGVWLLVEYVHGTGGALASLALGVLLVVVGVRLVNNRREPITKVLELAADDDEVAMTNVVSEIRKEAESYKNTDSY